VIFGYRCASFSIIAGNNPAKVPKDIVERGQAYEFSRGGDGLNVRTLSALGLDQQIRSDGATWLDRETTARDRSVITDSGFGRDVNKAIRRRAQRLVEMGLAIAKDGNIHIPSCIVATLERWGGRARRSADGERAWPDLHAKPGR
jgi:hypothetical protein